MSHVYVSDLDGTLLNSRAALSASAVERLNRLIADGVVFTVASARGVPAMQKVLAGLRLNLPVIGFNGAFVSDLQTGRHEIVHAIDPTIAAEARHLMAGFGFAPLISTYDGREDRVYYPTPQNAGQAYYLDDRIAHADPRLRPLEDVAAALAEQVVCLTCIDRKQSLEPLAARIDELYAGSVEVHLFENQYSPGWYWLTVHDRRASKDQAVRELIRTRDLEDRALVVFGDQVNDLKLFALASESIAVANAVPEVIARATEVIGHHDDESVIGFIEQHFGHRQQARSAGG
jgi:Cof subfamily protein (haloacid dehalogenase superfamily)